ncbi:hypothetical protein KGQ31_03210 [Patescibacteria group bacterium]|nr:hypothetical protein [Patescibacteria group bacterium]
MNIKIVREKISRAEAKKIGKEFYGEMVKGVADIEREIVALGGKWHMDANTVLTADGSNQSAVWGFNLYPDKDGEDRVEYVALINIRPALGNRDMYIEDGAIREKIFSIVNKLIP